MPTDGDLPAKRLALPVIGRSAGELALRKGSELAQVVKVHKGVPDGLVVCIE